MPKDPEYYENCYLLRASLLNLYLLIMKKKLQVLLSIIYIQLVFSSVIFAQAPANDDCSGAIAVTPTAFGSSCTSVIAATTLNATASSPLPSCGASVADDDIWYSFTAGSSAAIIRVSNGLQIPSGTANIAIEVYSGSCGSLSSVFCINGFAFGNGFRIIDGLTAGNTYFIRFWSTSASTDASFDFCVQDAPAAPVNDECVAAIAITTQPFGTTCAASVAANTGGATHSLPDASCGVSESNDDIWYSFTANSQSIILRFSNAIQTTTGSSAVLGYALYNGSCPSSTTTVSCDPGFGFNSGFRIIDGLIIGNTYYLKLFSSGANNYMSFNFCVQDVPSPPANNECTDAINITTQPYGVTCAASVSATTNGATHSLPDASCGVNESNDDIWYSFTANSQSVILRFSNAILTASGSSGVLGYALYNGTCPSSSATVSCDAGFGFNSGYKIIDGLTIGNTYYLKLFSSGANNYMSFDFCMQDIPSPPVNNECTGAIAITTQPYGVACSASVSATTNGATHSLPDASCGVTDSNDDIWYSFTANSQSVMLRFSNAILTTSSSSGVLGYALYNGSCPSSSATVSCDPGFGFSSGYQIIDGLTIGNTYYLRLFSQSGNNYMSFNFCVQDVPPPPVNNECAGAIAIGTQPFGATCAASVSANTTGATHSSPDPSCGVTESNDDIWYSFTANTQSVVLRFSNAILTTSGSSGVLGYALYNGSCPSSITTVSCDPGFGFNSGYKIIDGLTIGSTYYLRLFSLSGNNYMSFDFCVQDVPPPPPNDECAGAIPVTLTLPGTNCVASVAVNTTGATLSPNSPTCASGSNNDDLWYSFVASTTSAVIRFSNAFETTSPGGTTLGYALYNACPSGTASLACSNNFGFVNGFANLTGLVPGTTYYVRLFSSNANNYASFSFCIQSPLVNDECINAINVPVTNGFCINPILGSLNGATVSAGSVPPNCAPTTNSKDVWFKITIPATGNTIIQTSAVKITGNDLVMTAYTGACGALTQLACDNDSNPETFPSAGHPRITLTGRTPGEVILLQVTPLTGSSEEPFAICAWDETVSVLPAVSPGGNCITGNTQSIDSTQGNIYMWVPLLDNSGNIIAEVYGNGVNLGNMVTNLFVNTSGTVRNTNGKFYLDRNITMNPVVNGSARIRFYLKHDELTALQAADPTIAGINNLKITKTSTACLPAFSGVPTTISQQANATYGADHYLQFTTPSFSSFYIDGLTGVLPLHFISFTGDAGASGNRLKWIVMKDETIAVISIQRSNDGNHFTTIATQDKNQRVADINDEWEYRFTDNGNPTAGYFYRIELKDNNGKTIYSRIIRLGAAIPGITGIKVYPNPVADILQVQSDLASGYLQGELFDIAGARVLQFSVSAAQNGITNIPVARLAPGVYLLVIKENARGMQTRIKIVKR
jgi:hypothetical protein